MNGEHDIEVVIDRKFNFFENDFYLYKNNFSFPFGGRKEAMEKMELIFKESRDLKWSQRELYHLLIDKFKPIETKKNFTMLAAFAEMGNDGKVETLFFRDISHFEDATKEQ